MEEIFPEKLTTDKKYQRLPAPEKEPPWLSSLNKTFGNICCFIFKLYQ